MHVADTVAWREFSFALSAVCLCCQQVLYDSDGHTYGCGTPHASKSSPTTLEPQLVGSIEHILGP